jgi:hypothetical protein
MAIVEMLKPSLRARFHLGLLRRWADSMKEAVPFHGEILELPIERLAAHIQVIAERAIRTPQPRGVGLWVLHAVGIGDRDRVAELAASQTIQIRLDELQLQAESEWRSRLRLLAMATAAMVAAVLFGSLSQVDLHRFRDVLSVVPLVGIAAIVGGHFAGVARDLVAVVQRLRR